VFEFEPAGLGHDDLYCLNTLKGFDQTNTENWSYQAVGSKFPSIAIEAHVFRIARAQGITCVLWSANIAHNTCDNVISYNTETRVIGLPGPCKLR
jgi:hypothetical protein